MERLKQALDSADAVVIGAGAGLSASAGLTYSGERFETHFKDFARKYGIQDMYSGGFYPFATLEEYWAWWSRHIMINRYERAPRPVYDDLLKLVAEKDYFVLTTNVDHQFQLAGFEKKRLFYTQGDYGLWQCSEPCHDRTYDNEETVRRMVAEQRDMRVPEALVPRCPVCGKPMTMNLRADDTFVEDEGWHQARERYQMEDHIRWQNAKHFNVDSNVIRNSILMVQIKAKGGEERVSFPVRDLYRRYRTNGAEKVYQYVKGTLVDLKAGAAENLGVLNQILDFEAIKSRLILRLLNYYNNQIVLESCVYRQVGDIAIVLYIDVGVVQQNSMRNVFTTKVTREIFENWGKTKEDEDELFALALRNTAQRQPYVLYKMPFRFKPTMDTHNMERIHSLEKEGFTIDKNSITCLALSTKQETNGAIAIFYPGMMDRLCEVLDDDLYLVFSGIDEVFVHPVHGKMELSSMQKSLSNMNQELNDREEIVTRYMYRYSRERKKLMAI